jgi:hypothetical protein
VVVDPGDGGEWRGVSEATAARVAELDEVAHTCYPADDVAELLGEHMDVLPQGGRDP